MINLDIYFFVKFAQKKTYIVFSLNYFYTYIILMLNKLSSY